MSAVNGVATFTNVTYTASADGVAFPDFLIFISAFRQDETSPGWAVELPEKPFPQTP